jgi:hypothetical protein
MVQAGGGESTATLAAMMVATSRAAVDACRALAQSATSNIGGIGSAVNALTLSPMRSSPVPIVLPV